MRKRRGTRRKPMKIGTLVRVSYREWSYHENLKNGTVGLVQRLDDAGKDDRYAHVLMFDTSGVYDLWNDDLIILEEPDGTSV